MSKNQLRSTAVALVPPVTLSFLLAACGSALRQYSVPDLNCGEDSKATTTIDFRYIQPGQAIRLGHTATSDSGLNSDIAVTVTSEGVVTASSVKRSDVSEQPKTQIQGHSSGGVDIISNDEAYTATAEAETSGSGFKLTINGRCVDPSVALKASNVALPHGVVG